jgi:hypothetical protein
MIQIRHQNTRHLQKTTEIEAEPEKNIKTSLPTGIEA